MSFLFAIIIAELLFLFLYRLFTGTNYQVIGKVNFDHSLEIGPGWVVLELMKQLGISEEEHLEGLANLARGVKLEGATVGIRISHAGAQTSENICGEQPIGPSIMNFGRDFDISREFDKGDVEEIILNFVHAAERAEEVGMDFIEINGSEQHLLDQCCNIKYNTRFDEYGSAKIESRIQLAIEIVNAIKKRKSVSLPISYYFAIFKQNLDIRNG